MWEFSYSSKTDTTNSAEYLVKHFITAFTLGTVIMLSYETFLSTTKQKNKCQDKCNQIFIKMHVISLKNVFDLFVGKNLGIPKI